MTCVRVLAQVPTVQSTDSDKSMCAAATSNAQAVQPGPTAANLGHMPSKASRRAAVSPHRFFSVRKKEFRQIVHEQEVKPIEPIEVYASLVCFRVRLGSTAG